MNTRTKRFAGALAAAILASAPLAAQENPSAALLAFSCASCHGTGGRSPGEIPSIDGLDAEALAAAVRAFREGEIEGTVMNRIARGYTDAQIDMLAAYLAAKHD